MRHLADASAAVASARAYEPFGVTLLSAGAASSSYAFTGQWADGTGVVHLRAHYQSPAQGRFITADSWGGEGHQPSTFNAWVYALNNPVRFVDPSGYISAEEAVSANVIYHALWSTYNVRIGRDWGAVRTEPKRNLAEALYPNPDLIPADLGGCWRWVEGKWGSIREIELVQEAVDDVAAPLGDPQGTSRKFRAAMRYGVDVVRKPSFMDSGAFAPHPILGALIGDVVLVDFTFLGSDQQAEEFSRYTIAHELGHVWDQRHGQRLSFGMAKYLGTIFQTCIEDVQYLGTVCYTSFDTDRGPEPPPGRRNNQYARTSPQEDWAESFAPHVYPNYWRNRDLPGILLGDLRREYISAAIEGIQ